jgi:hypothetical protein
MFETAKCRKIKWHDWDVTATRGEYQLERCKACGTRMAHRLDAQGRPVYGRAYYDAHIRDFCHPLDVDSHRIFYELYGHKRLRDNQRFMEKEAGREQRIEELSREFRDFTSKTREYIF